MEDREIIELYWSRSESAIIQTSEKYGRYAYKIAYAILGSFEDSEECVNDTYIKIWNSIPRIIKTISRGVVLIISPSLKKLYCRSSYLLYNQNKHCGFVIWSLQLRLFGGDSNRSGLSELVISWITLDVSFA